MQCPNCHGNIPDNSKFCTLCGARIPETMVSQSAVKSEYSTQVNTVQTGTSAYGTVGGNSVQKVLSGVDFRHFDLRGLVTIEAILWIIPFLAMFFPVNDVSTSYSKPKGLIFDILENGLGDTSWEFTVIIFGLIILTTGMVVIGFLQILRPVNPKITAIYGIIGILISLYSVVDLTFQDKLLSAISSFVTVTPTFMGNLMHFSVWILLVMHCWQIWMMAVQGQRLK